MKHKEQVICVEEKEGLGPFRCCKCEKYDHIAVVCNTLLLLLSSLYYITLCILCENRLLTG